MGTDSKWGSSRDCQIEASYYGKRTKVVQIPEVRFLGFVLAKAREKQEATDEHLSIGKGDIVPDDVVADRSFKYRCGLIKAINVLSGSRSTMTMYLDGFSNVSLDVGNTEFVFDDQLENGPVVEVHFNGKCTRYGKMISGRTDTFASLIFKDQEQMKSHLLAITATPDPKRRGSKTPFGNGCSDSADTSNDSSWPFAAGVVVGATLG